MDSNISIKSPISDVVFFLSFSVLLSFAWIQPSFSIFLVVSLLLFVLVVVFEQMTRKKYVDRMRAILEDQALSRSSILQNGQIYYKGLRQSQMGGLRIVVIVIFLLSPVKTISYSSLGFLWAGAVAVTIIQLIKETKRYRIAESTVTIEQRKGWKWVEMTNFSTADMVWKIEAPDCVLTIKNSKNEIVEIDLHAMWSPYRFLKAIVSCSNSDD